MSNTEKLIEYMERKRKCFFHFTDARNVPMIKESGLLSMRSQRERSIIAIAPGGNEWSLKADRRSGMDQYVHLCFFRNHPMEWRARNDGRIEETVFLEIAPSVLRISGAMITNVVANRANAVPRSVEEMIPELDLEIIYTHMNWKIPEINSRLKVAKKYEILIPERISLEFIKGL